MNRRNFLKNSAASSIASLIPFNFTLANNNTSNISPTITIIDNPLTDIRISEIDNDPDVIVQQGKNYIMKYIKKKVDK